MSPDRKATPSRGGNGPKKNPSTSRRAATGPTSRKAGRPGKPGSRTASGKPRKSLGRRILKWGLLAALALVLLGGVAFAYGYTTTNVPDPNKDFQAQTTFVYYSDGQHEIGRFANQNRTSVPLSDVPQHVQDAVIAAEDRSFETNKGIDPKGILRAAFTNAKGGATQGASTITQQYVKVLYLSQERTLTRKVKEAFVSLKIQRQESKAEILQGYLNTIYFGRGAYGVQAAAQAYFDKDAKDLTVQEGAVLASVLNSPTAFDPANGTANRERLLGRYQYVLNGMVSMGNLESSKADQAKARLPTFPKIKSEDQYGGQRGHVLALVKNELLRNGFSDQEISGGGLRVTTTFTRNAMDAAKAGVAAQRPKGLKGLHVGAASVDPATGALKGFYAGQDYLKSQINYATRAAGSPGSAFKPFALAAGIDDGYSLKSTFQGNSPYVYPNGRDKVVNEGPGGGNDYGAAIPLTTATTESVNTAFVDLTESMDNGPEKIKVMAVKMGVPSNAPGLEPVAGISLGSATISPVDMANSYGTIADGGKAKAWYVINKVASAEGKALYRAPKKETRVLADDIDRDVSFALQQVVKAGTGRNALSLGRPAAGKTGTATNADGNVSSSWFVGYTPQLSTAIMYVRGDGNDNLNCVKKNGKDCTPGYLVPYFGAEYPTKTWTDVMRQSLDDAPTEQFPPAANVEAKQDGHTPQPTYTPAPTTPTQQPTKQPTRKPSPTPTPTPTLVTPTPTPVTPTPTPTPITPSPSSPPTIIPPSPTGNPNGANPPASPAGGP
ncbi:MAG: transglycosylase domain-containing protein [Nocardioidaceae bacterium]